MTDQIKVNLPNGKGSAYFPMGTPPEEIEGAINNLMVPSKSDAIAQQFGGGALMNFGDEAAAGVRAALPEFSNWMMRGPEGLKVKGTPAPQTVSQAPTFEGRYEEELARERNKAKDFETLYPKTATGANMAGGVASTMLALPAAASAAGPSMLGNMAKLGGVGAGLGGVAGYGAGEGSEGRLSSALMGAGLGGTIGVATPIAGVAGRAILESAPGRAITENVVSPGLRRLANAFGESTPVKSLSAAAPDSGPMPSSLMQTADSLGNVAQTGAVDRLATALQRSRMDPGSVERRLGRLGDEAVIADVDPQFLSMARGAKVMPGQTRSTAEQVMTNRDRGAGNRLVGAFEGNEPPPSSFDLRGDGQAFDQYLRAVGSRAYGAMDEAGLKQTPELMKIYENPHVNAAIDRVMKAEEGTRIGTDRAPASPVEIMHKVKQAIWDLGFDADTARPGPMASWFRDLGTRYVDLLKGANPALREADAAYSAAAKLPEHFDAGRSFLRGGSTEAGMNASAPAMENMLERADPLQRLAARSGSTNAAREQALESNRGARALAQRIDESTPVQNKLRKLYEPEQANRIVGQAEAERTFANTSNQLLRGSQTAEKAVDSLDLGGAGLRISPQGVQPRLWERLGELVSKISAPNEKVRDEIGRIMLNPNSAENKRILALAAQMIRSRQTGNAFRPGIAEGISSGATER